MELIDRSALVLTFEAKIKATDFPLCVVSTIKAALTIDAVPVVHGEWIDSDEYKGYQVCSACRGCYVDSVWIDGNKWPFCPNCGAKMDKKNSLPAQADREA